MLSAQPPRQLSPEAPRRLSPKVTSTTSTLPHSPRIHAQNGADERPSPPWNSLRSAVAARFRTSPPHSSNGPTTPGTPNDTSEARPTKARGRRTTPFVKPGTVQETGHFSGVRGAVVTDTPTTSGTEYPRRSSARSTPTRGAG